MLNGLLIDIEYCSGCHSCEVACRTERELGPKQYGIKVLEVKPFVVDEADDRFIWDYHPEVTELCDLCEQRVARGEKPSCALHCLADAITYGPVDDLVAQMKEKGGRMSLLIP